MMQQCVRQLRQRTLAVAGAVDLATASSWRITTITTIPSAEATAACRHLSCSAAVLSGSPAASAAGAWLSPALSAASKLGGNPPSILPPSCRALLAPGSHPWISRSFHASGAAHDSESSSPLPGANPLQQSPAVLVPEAISESSQFDEGVVQQGDVVPDGESGPRQARAIARNLKISPQKLNDFARVIRHMRVDDAIMQCRYSVKKASKIVETALVSAYANATNNHSMDGERLYVGITHQNLVDPYIEDVTPAAEHAFVGKGQYLKRIRMHGRGRSATMYKYRSHLTVVLEERAVKLASHAKIASTRLKKPLLLRPNKHVRHHPHREVA